MGYYNDDLDFSWGKFEGYKTYNSSKLLGLRSSRTQPLNYVMLLPDSKCYFMHVLNFSAQEYVEKKKGLELASPQGVPSTQLVLRLSDYPTINPTHVSPTICGWVWLAPQN